MRSLTLSSILKDLLNNMKTALDSIKNHTAALAAQEKVVTKLQNYQDGLEQKFNDTKKQAADALTQHNSSTNAHSDIRAAISSNNETIRRDREQAQTNLNAHNTSSTAHQDIRNQIATLNQKHTDDMAALRQDLSTVYHYKSSINSYNDLPKSGMKVGDIYNIQTKDDAHNIRPGDNVSWNGTSWDNLSGVVDLSWLLPKAGGVITGDLSVQGNLHANADTASKIKTARTINFTGAADGKVSFDGTEDVSVVLAELNHTEAIVDLTDTTKYDADTYYPVVGKRYIGWDLEHKYRCWTPIHAVKTAPWGHWANGNGDYSAELKITDIMNGWGARKNYITIDLNSCNGADVMPITYSQMTNASRSVFFVRGGGKYWFSSTCNSTWELKTEAFTESGNTVAPTKTYFTPESRNPIKKIGIDITGNAATATQVTATAPIGEAVDLVCGKMGGNDNARIRISSSAENAGELEIATDDDGTEPIVVRQYAGASNGSFTQRKREVYILNSAGNTSFPGTVTAPTFSGVLNGNAATASKLATPRTIALTGGVTGSTTFDGSSNITINATVTQSANAGTADAAATIKNFEQGTVNAFRNVWFSDNTNNAKPVYNESIQYNPSTNVLKAGTFQGALNGNAATATNADKLDGYHENAFLRAREDASSNQENTLWSQIGIKQYANKLPDGLTDVYNYGATASLPAGNARLDLWYSDGVTQGLTYRTGWDDKKSKWREVLDSSTYNKYTPKLDGTGAKGTWGINISGTAERSNRINTQEVGHTDNTERRIFVSGSGDNTIQCYDPNMTYNSATQTLTVKAINGTAAKAAQDAAGNIIIDTYETKANVDDFMNNCTEDEIKKLWIFVPKVVEPPAPLQPVQITKTFDANVFRVGEKIIISNKSLQEYDGDTAFNVVYLDDTDHNNKRVLYKISNKDNFYGIEDTKYDARIEIGNPSSNTKDIIRFVDYLDSASSPTAKSYEDEDLLKILFNSYPYNYPSFKKNTISRALSNEYVDDVFTALNRFLSCEVSSSHKEEYSTFVDNLKNNIDDNKQKTFQYLSSLHEKYYTLLDRATNYNVKKYLNFMDLFNNGSIDKNDILIHDGMYVQYISLAPMDSNFGRDEEGNYNAININSINGTYLIYLIDAAIHLNHIDFDTTPLAVNTIPVTVTLEPVKEK